jgi:hypothetical protein
MKKLSFITCLLFLAGCSVSQKFPDKMPDDFKVEYHLVGGMANMYRTVVLQKGEGSDKGREDDGPDYDYKLDMSNSADLEKLYTDLKQLKVFTIKGQNKGDVMDRGGESIQFTINGKTYDVDNSQSNFISKEDGPAFDNGIKLILDFASTHRLPQTQDVNNGTSNDQTDKVDSLSTGMDPQLVGSSNDDNLGTKDESLNMVFPPKMPNDFKIVYDMSGGITGAYRKIVLQYGSCSDEGKKAGESKYSNSFMNMNLKDFEALYNELYKLKAFELEYTTNNKVADRGGEKLVFTINGREYTASDKDTDYIKSSDKNAFKKSITLVLEYVDQRK